MEIVVLVDVDILVELLVVVVLLLVDDVVELEEEVVVVNAVKDQPVLFDVFVEFAPALNTAPPEAAESLSDR